MTPERRYVEFRSSADGRSLSGTAIDYRDRSPSHCERIAPGAFAPLPASLELNLLHDGAMPVGRAYLADGPERIEFRAEIQQRAVQQMIRDSYVRGASVEFHAERESRDPDGTRVVERGRMVGLALVRDPSYPKSRIELRARLGKTIRQRIPTGRPLACQCSGVECKFAEFLEAELGAMFERAFSAAEGEILAARGSYGEPLASKSRGGVRGTMAGREGVLEVDLPDSAAGRAVLDDIENVGGAMLARPFLDAELSESHVREGRAAGQGNVRVYSKPVLRSVIVGATDATANWPVLEVVDTPDMETPQTAPARRRALWL